VVRKKRFETKFVPNVNRERFNFTLGSIVRTAFIASLVRARAAQPATTANIPAPQSRLLSWLNIFKERRVSGTE
jgi:hypothetical protein